jgi:hypothetical protein
MHENAFSQARGTYFGIRFLAQLPIRGGEQSEGPLSVHCNSYGIPGQAHRIRFRGYAQIMWPTLLGCESVGRAVRRSSGGNGKLILQSTVMRVPRVLPRTSAIGIPVPTAS